MRRHFFAFCALFLTALLFTFASCDFSFKEKSDDQPIGNWTNCLRQDGNGWYKAVGPEYIEKAFLAARNADPDAKLYYNDYNLNNANKARAVYKMVSDINSRYPNVKGRKLIDGIGMQSHHHIGTNSQTVKASIELFASLGVEISITELDIIAAGKHLNQTNPPPWDSTASNNQAIQYAAMFAVFKAQAANIKRVTFWGIDDGTHWRNLDGSGSYAAMLNSDYSLKPAFYGVTGVAAGESDTWETVQPLKELFENDFLMGNIISPNDLLPANKVRLDILKRHYNTLTAENHMKPDNIAPLSKPASNNWASSYRFTNADNIVNAAIAAEMNVVGHTLIWHSQTPSWLTSGSKEVVTENLNKYVTDVVTHFKGKLICWDVVNEAIRDGLTNDDVKD